MFKSESHKLNTYVNLSIEAMWLARAVHDGLDVLLGDPSDESSQDMDRARVLSISRDVFERLGTCGHRTGSVDSYNQEWTAASRTEFIRQVAVNWRAFIDASFGMTCASDLIMSLTDYEISVLEQVLRLDKEIRTNTEGVVFCMSQELNLLSQHQRVLRALRRRTYMESVQSRIS